MWGDVLSFSQHSCIETTLYFFTSLIFSAALSISAAGPAVQGRCTYGLEGWKHLDVWGQEQGLAPGHALCSAVSVQEQPELLALPQLQGRHWLLPRIAGIAMTRH